MVHALNRVISVTGLGYVGLPLAVAFGMKFRTIGYDVKPERIQELRAGRDRTGEVSEEDVGSCRVEFTDNLEDLRVANFHVVAVPTPVDAAKRPDLRPVLNASESVGRILKRGDLVVYESTVYPGLTEEECIPVLEEVSNLRAGVDFKVGYSPERINPGDKEHCFRRITKVVSGQDQETLDTVAEVYGAVVEAGIFKAASIRVAEAAKVIENTQRDINIALMNELAIICERLGIETREVLRAASTKWNFLDFQPGLVGGHCIGVDPYYLTHKAERVGYSPQVILSGRRINDGMGIFIATQTVKLMARAGHSIQGSRVLVLGLTFKENCPDLRNSKVTDIVQELTDFGVQVQVHDPLADKREAMSEYGIALKELSQLEPADAVVIAVAHDQFREMSLPEISKLMGDRPVVVDVKGIIAPSVAENSGIRLWRL